MKRLPGLPAALVVSAALFLPADAAAGPSEARPDPAAEAFAAAPGELRRCMTRNRHVDPDPPPEVRRASGWDRNARRAAYERIMLRVAQHIEPVRDPANPERGKLSPFQGYKPDIANRRVIMWLDPTLIDLPEFRRWAHRLSVRAHEQAGVRGPRLRVAVQKGCFSSREIADLHAYLKSTYMTSGIRHVLGFGALDGRIHAWFTDRGKARAIQRRFGPVLAAHIGTSPRLPDHSG